MTLFFWFIIGLAIGYAVGWVAMALLMASRDD